MKDNPIIEKSVNYAARIINLHKYLVEKNHEQIISKQIVRCGTVIGAYVNTAYAAQSDADRKEQLGRALQAAAETEYWLMLLRTTGNVGIDLSRSLMDDLNDIKKLIVTALSAGII